MFTIQIKVVSQILKQNYGSIFFLLLSSVYNLQFLRNTYYFLFVHFPCLKFDFSSDFPKAKNYLSSLQHRLMSGLLKQNKRPYLSYFLCRVIEYCLHFVLILGEFEYTFPCVIPVRDTCISETLKQKCSKKFFIFNVPKIKISKSIVVAD